MGIKIRKRIQVRVARKKGASSNLKVRRRKAKEKTKVIRPLGVGVKLPAPEQTRNIPFKKGEEVRFEAWTLNLGVPSEVQGTIDFRIIVPASPDSNGVRRYEGDNVPHDDCHIVGSGSLYAPNARRTLESLRRGKVGVILLGKGGKLERLTPK